MLIDRALLSRTPKLAKQLYKDDEFKRETPISTKVLKIAAGHKNTLVLLNGGELYICGSDS